MAGSDTIFALSSGPPPAAIAVVRISGPSAADALISLTGKLPAPRKASLRRLRDPADATRVLDDALVLFLPGPDNATGEDTVELHLHGGRALVRAVEGVLADLPGLRPAEPGEFTRRAFANGKLDLSEAEGLADVLSAETALQLANARALASGVLSSAVSRWRDEVLALSAMVEAVLDFSDEEDPEELGPTFYQRVDDLARDIRSWVDAPTNETLREGFRVGIAGPPNSGKSSLFNALVGEDAAISTPIAGTTRDVLIRPVALESVPFTFIDMAGLRQETADPIERIGISRAEAEIARADLVLWLGEEEKGPQGAWDIETKSDLGARTKKNPRFRISSITGEQVGELKTAMISAARATMPRPGETAVNRFQKKNLRTALDHLNQIGNSNDGLLAGENLRLARLSFDRLTGATCTEDVLDTLFGRFCIGK